MALPDFLNYSPWDWEQRKGNNDYLELLAGVCRGCGGEQESSGWRREATATAVEMIGIAVSAEVVMEVDEWPRGSDINKKANRETKR